MKSIYLSDCNIEENSAFLIYKAASKLSSHRTLKVDAEIDSKIYKRQIDAVRKITRAIPEFTNESILPFALDWINRNTVGTFTLSGIFDAVRSLPVLFVRNGSNAGKYSCARLWILYKVVDIVD